MDTRRRFYTWFWAVLLIGATAVWAADVVPPVVEQPGTQPGEISNLESPDKCDNCHGGYNSAVEPAHNWRGSMMAHAGRDPIFWATLGVAEQDFNGAGDLCLRCHSTGGWLAGRSTPTDGSGLMAGDSDGVECDYCHKLTNPDDFEYQGVMNDPFVANEPNTNDAEFDWDDPNGIEGYLGSGMSSMWGGADKLGPFDNAEARHQFMRSKFHRDRDFCGPCHDVSNPVVGELAHNFGAMTTVGEVQTGSGDPGDMVAFNNPPYRYGIVERTFSEYKSAQISQTLVDNYPSLPADLKGGVLEQVWNAATAEGARSANYHNPDQPRYFSCQSCHLRPVTGTGANKHGVPVRVDLPLHDMTGGNYWMAEAIEYLDSQGKLRLGGGMTQEQISALEDGALRAREQLKLAATLSLQQIGGQDYVKVVNHTGHKLISGYPEGRRMWLHTTWHDQYGAVVREDGAWGVIRDGNGNPVVVNGVKVKSLLDPDDTNTRVWQARMGMTQQWAEQLASAGVPSSLPLSYDRYTGAVTKTLGELAAATGTVAETFHFALNNTVAEDNRIPPYGTSQALATKRNALPDSHFLDTDNAVLGDYRYYDLVPLNPPAEAVSADIELLYQPTSWEYIQFLWLANTGNNSFLAAEGDNMLDAWLHTGMAAPEVMASTTWGAPTTGCTAPVPDLLSADAADKSVALAWTATAGADPLVGYRLYYDQAQKGQQIADLECALGDCTSYTDTGLTNGQTYCYKVTSYTASCESEFSAPVLCATPNAPGQPDATVGAGSLQTGYWQTTGKGKNATTSFVTTDTFAAGDTVVVRATVLNQDGLPVSSATVAYLVTGPETRTLNSNPSDASGVAEASWNTQKPNRKGGGGTATGAYRIEVTDVTVTGYAWDNQRPFVTVTIQ